MRFRATLLPREAATLELQLHPEAQSILERMAAQDGLSAAQLAERALLQYLEDREDYEDAVAVLHDSDPADCIPFEEVVRSLEQSIWKEF